MVFVPKCLQLSARDVANSRGSLLL